MGVVIAMTLKTIKLSLAEVDLIWDVSFSSRGVRFSSKLEVADGSVVIPSVGPNTLTPGDIERLISMADTKWRDEEGDFAASFVASDALVFIEFMESDSIRVGHFLQPSREFAVSVESTIRDDSLGLFVEKLKVLLGSFI